MALQETIFEIEQQSALRVRPLLGIRGLAMALQKDRTPESDEKMKEHLRQFKEKFCDALADLEPEARTAPALGFRRILDDQGLLSAQETNKEILEEDFAKVSENVRRILEDDMPDRKSLESSIATLQKFLVLASAFSKQHHHETLIRYQHP